ncbi:MAG: alcohol dehydrogenase catalytic domain-containing protein [Pseudomonadota bacterium]
MNEAVYIHGAKDVRIGRYDRNDTVADPVAVDVAAVGLCGSDLHYFKDGAIGAATIAKPFVPGHEFSARLLADDEALGLTKGTLVAVDPASACGACEWCHQGHPNLCPKVVFTGAPPYDGAMRRQMGVARDRIIPVPDTLSALDAAMLEPLGVCIHAMDLARPRLGETVGVLGCGPIGLGIIQLLANSGAGRILAIDPAAYRSAHGPRNGAHEAGLTVSDILDMTDGRGCDLIIEATNAPDGFADAVRATRIGGRVVLVGIPDGDIYTLPAAESRRRGLTIRFSRRMGETYPRAIALTVAGKVDHGAMVSHEVALEETPDAFARQADLADGALKTVIYPNGTDN